MAENAHSTYFQRVHRRTTLRGSGSSATAQSSHSFLKSGPRRYEQIRAAAETSFQTRATKPQRISAVVATAETTSLKSDLARLKAEQDKRFAPKWWSGFAARPIRTAVLVLVLLSMTGVAAIAGPILWRSYVAYQDVFVEPLPNEPSGFEVAVNDQGTPIIVTDASTTEVAEVVPDWDGESRLTLLLLGVDRREDEYSRSDTIILVNIDPVEKTARMLSIPRDLKVIIPGFGSQKINAAYAFGDANDNVPGGGPGLMMRTIEQNFGIDIDFYAEVDFNGFVKIVDTVGGVTLDVPYPIRDNEYPGPANQYMRIYFPSGWQHMTGERVLQYARTRHDDGDGRRSCQTAASSARATATSADDGSDWPGTDPDLRSRGHRSNRSQPRPGTSAGATGYGDWPI